MVKNTNSKTGFTVIEVVLVLAIAGLIFLMVFIALPALQRSQRDSQRRNDYAALASSISGMISNNSGRFPKAGASIKAETNINKDGQAPNGADYKIQVIEATEGGGFKSSPSTTIDKGNITPTVGDPSNNEDSVVMVVTHANCNDDNEGLAFPKYTKAARAFAVYGQLESSTYCQAVNDTDTYKE